MSQPSSLVNVVSRTAVSTCPCCDTVALRTLVGICVVLGALCQVAVWPAAPNNTPVSGLAPMTGATTNMRGCGLFGSTDGGGGLFRIALSRSPTSVSASGAADSACPASAWRPASVVTTMVAVTTKRADLASTTPLCYRRPPALTAATIGTITFACTFGSAVGAAYLRDALPPQHLSKES